MIFIRLCSSDDVLRPSDGDSDLNFIDRQKRDFVPLLLLPDSSCFGVIQQATPGLIETGLIVLINYQILVNGLICIADGQQG